MVFLNREEKYFEGGKRDIFIYNKSILKVKSKFEIFLSK